MPELDYALLCDYARAEGGVAHVIAAGIDTIYRSEVPSVANLGLLARIIVADDENHARRACRGLPNGSGRPRRTRRSRQPRKPDRGGGHPPARPWSLDEILGQSSTSGADAHLLRLLERATGSAGTFTYAEPVQLISA